MRLKYERKFVVEIYDVFLTVRFEEERKDIQTFLQKHKDKKLPNDGVSPKIVRYLQDLGLLRKDETLSIAGARVLEKGLYYAVEQGVYRVWTTNNDDLLGTIIIGLRRVNIERNDKTDGRNKKQPQMETLRDFDGATHTVFLAEENKKDRQAFQTRVTNIELLSDNFEIGENIESLKGFYVGEENYKIVWTLGKKEEPEIQLNGTLSLKIDGKDSGCTGELPQLKVTVDADDFFEIVENAFVTAQSRPSHFQRWDSETESLRVMFSDLQDEEVERGIRKNMQFEVDEHFDGGAGSVTVFDAPLLANDKTEAVKWRDALFTKYMQTSYRLPGEWQKFLAEKQKEFAPLAPHLAKETTPEIAYLAEALSPDREAYFHFYAPIDLQPV